MLVLLGLAVGTLGTLVGAGGGFILVPVLLWLYPSRDANTITAMSLLVVFANAASGSVAYARQRRIDYVSGTLFAAATLPGAVAGALVVGLVPRALFGAVFATALTLLAVVLLLPYRPAIQAPVAGWWTLRRTVRDLEGDTYAYMYSAWQGVLISLGAGFVSSLLGIGGGVVHVPVMVLLLHFPVHVAAATSHFVLALMALQATVTHIVSGALTWDRALAQAGAIAAGAVPGAQIGARFAHRTSGPVIVRFLGVALLLVALRLAVAAIVA